MRFLVILFALTFIFSNTSLVQAGPKSSQKASKNRQNILNLNDKIHPQIFSDVEDKEAKVLYQDRQGAWTKHVMQMVPLEKRPLVEKLDKRTLKKLGIQLPENKLIMHLVESQYDLDHAFGRITRAQSWIESYDFDKIDEENLKDQLDTQALRIIGKDKQGRSVILLSGQYLNPGLADDKAFLQYFYYIFDKALQENEPNVDQYYLIVDFYGVGIRNLAINKLMLLIPALNTIHVDCLQKMVIVNTNWFADAVLSVSMKFVTSKSNQLLKFFSSDESLIFAKYLKRDLPVETLPIQYGGQNKIKLDQADQAKVEALFTKKYSDQKIQFDF